MKKELEALERFIKECENDWKTQPKKWVDGAINSNVSKYMDSLKRILTPPTADEVCEALQEDCKIEKVVYKSGRFYDEEDGETIVDSFYVGKDMVINFNDFMLNIKSLTLVCRFYEGIADE